jgi:hypothetical protein
VTLKRVPQDLASRSEEINPVEADAIRDAATWMLQHGESVTSTARDSTARDWTARDWTARISPVAAAVGKASCASIRLAHQFA